MITTLMLRPVSGEGWIGSWAPGIGDPTAAGWLTTLLYFVTCGYITFVLRTKMGGAARAEATVWRMLGLALFALGINKQLDLQTAFTELGRVLAYRQGWYEARGIVQKAFVSALAIGAIATAGWILHVARRMPPPTRGALVGAVVLVGFVLARASSFHHVDWVLGARVLGLRANWIFEMGGISLVLLASIWRSQWSKRR